MKIITFLLSALFCISVSDAQKKPFENQKSNRIEKVINSQWTFNYFPAETADKGYETPGFDDSRWHAISLPHTWNTYETAGELHPSVMNAEESDNLYWWRGWGWYRKHFSISRDYSGRKVFIEFEGVQKYCKVWLNGKLLGDHEGGNGSFGFDITGYIKPGEDNLLAVAVNNKQNDQFKISDIAAGNINVYGGIYHDVTLVLKDKLHIPMQSLANQEGGTFFTTPQVSEKEAVVRIETRVKNDNKEKKNCTLITSIADAANKIVQVIKSGAVINPGQLYKFDQTSKSIIKPHLWSKKDPYLYKVFTEVIDGKVLADTYMNPSGLRFSVGGDTAMMLTENRVQVGLEDVFIKNADRTKPAITSEMASRGEPAKIALAGSHQKIRADRGSVSTITADIVDSKGNHVNGVTKTVRWNVSGPATLVGPPVYESDLSKRDQMEGNLYGDMPVSNAIRSTGKPGIIHVSVSATGLASGSFDIEAEEIKPDNSVITEPVLEDAGRKPVARKELTVNRLEEVPREIKMTSDEFNLSPSDKPGFAREIRNYIVKNNTSTDTGSIEFITLVDLFASHLLNNNGHLIADDYNFNVDHYNNCRLISGYINSTKLPPLFKEGLKKYYANAIIIRGSEKNAGEEMNWLNWIPSGGTVVIFQQGSNVSGKKGAIFTSKSELADLIAVVHPGFANFSEEAKERALIFISKMNPYVKVSSSGELNSEVYKKQTTNVSYTAEKGQPVLIPMLKFISE